VNNVVITCVTTPYTVNVQLNGLVTTTPVSVVFQNNGGNNLTFTANGTQPFTVQVNNNSPYSVTISTQPGTQSQMCNVVMGSGTMPTNNKTIQAYCGRTCNSILSAGSLSGDGLLSIDPDGSGPIAAFQAYCVMGGVAGGGWTLIESANNPKLCTAGAVTQGTCSYMPLATMQALANLSTQVHARTPVAAGHDPTNYATSVVATDSQVIQNLRNGAILNANVVVGTSNADNAAFAVQQALWPTFASGVGDGPVSASVFNFWNVGGPACGAQIAADTWPSIYWACDNGGAPPDGGTNDTVGAPLGGWHLTKAQTGYSKWEWQDVNHFLEAYAR
jgi:hypothetical protein